MVRFWQEGRLGGEQTIYCCAETTQTLLLCKKYQQNCRYIRRHHHDHDHHHLLHHHQSLLAPSTQRYPPNPSRKAAGWNNCYSLFSGKRTGEKGRTGEKTGNSHLEKPSLPLLLLRRRGIIWKDSPHHNIQPLKTQNSINTKGSDQLAALDIIQNLALRLGKGSKGPISIPWQIQLQENPCSSITGICTLTQSAMQCSPFLQKAVHVKLELGSRGFAKLVIDQWGSSSKQLFLKREEM